MKSRCPERCRASSPSSVASRPRATRRGDTIAVEIASAQPGTSASLLNLADYRISFADGRPLDRYPDDTARVVAVGARRRTPSCSPARSIGPRSPALSRTSSIWLAVDALRGKPVGIVAMGATPASLPGRRLAARGAGVVRSPGGAHERLSRVRPVQGRQAGRPGRPGRLGRLVRALVAMAGSSRDQLGPPPLAEAEGSSDVFAFGVRVDGAAHVALGRPWHSEAHVGVGVARAGPRFRTWA